MHLCDASSGDLITETKSVHAGQLIHLCEVLPVHRHLAHPRGKGDDVCYGTPSYKPEKERDLLLASRPAGL